MIHSQDSHIRRCEDYRVGTNGKMAYPRRRLVACLRVDAQAVLLLTLCQLLLTIFEFLIFGACEHFTILARQAEERRPCPYSEKHRNMTGVSRQMKAFQWGGFVFRTTWLLLEIVRSEVGASSAKGSDRCLATRHVQFQRFLARDLRLVTKSHRECCIDQTFCFPRPGG